MRVFISLIVYLSSPCIAQGKLAAPVNFADVMEFQNQSKKYQSEVGIGPKVIPSKDCTSFMVTLKTKTDGENIHLPNNGSCLGFVIDTTKDAECDRKSFPMTCTFYTIDKHHEIDDEAKHFYFSVEKKSLDALKIDDTFKNLVISDEKPLTTKGNILGEEHFQSEIRRGRQRGKRDEQYEWVSEAAKKMAEAVFEGGCSPSYTGRDVRNVDCDLCWALFVPHPCNCN